MTLEISLVIVLLALQMRKITSREVLWDYLMDLKKKKDYKEVAADNTKLSERDMLINKIGSDKIQYICDMYMIKKDNLSIDFLTKLASSEEIINFLTQNFLTSESVQK